MPFSTAHNRGLAADRRAAAVKADQCACDKTFVGMQFKVDGRGVRVTRVEREVWFVTWPEGKGERQMRCGCSWRHWRLKYLSKRER